MVQRVVGHVRVVVIGRRPTDADFMAHIAECLETTSLVRGVLILGDDEAAVPSAKARQELAKAGLLKTPTAVISNMSLVARSVLTAIGWLGGSVRGFTPDRFDDACNYLAVSPAQRTQIHEAIAQLRSAVTEPAERRGSGTTRASTKLRGA